MTEKALISQQKIDIESKKVTFVNNVARWLVIISATLIAITLIISWALWKSFYEEELKQFLISVNIDLANQGYEYKIDFQILTIVTLIYAGVGLVSVPVLALIFKRKNIFLFLTSLTSIVYALMIVGGSTFLFITCCPTLTDYWDHESLTITLVLILPWICEFTFGALLLLSSCWISLSFLFKDKATKTNDAADHQASSYDDASSNNLFWKHDDISNDDLPDSTDSDEAILTTQGQIPENEPRMTPTTTIPTTNPSEARTNARGDETNNFSSPHITNTITITGNNPIEETNDHLLSEIIWTPEQIEHNWNKGLIIANVNPDLYRYDYAGALIFKNAFVNTPTLNSETNTKSYNWTIIMKKPLIYGGNSNDENLLPSHSLNAISKANNYPRWKTDITYDGKENVVKIRKWKD